MAASGGSVVVLNSGSSSVKFALIAAGTGERLLGGLADKVGTPEAVLRIQRPAGDVTEPLADGSRQAVIASILDRVANAAHGRSTGGRISRPGPVRALVVPTDEELMIARDTARLIAARSGSQPRS
jgi:acetate kinase